MLNVYLVRAVVFRPQSPRGGSRGTLRMVFSDPLPLVELLTISVWRIYSVLSLRALTGITMR